MSANLRGCTNTPPNTNLKVSLSLSLINHLIVNSTSAKTLTDVVEELKKLLAEDIAVTLRRLQSLLPADSYKQDEIILLCGKYNSNRRLELQGVSTNEEIRRLDNEVRRDCLLLLNELSADDFDPSKTRRKKNSPTRQGYLIYRIPRQMAVDEETKCLIRISLNNSLSYENITIDKDTEEKELRKVSKTMMIEMYDPSGKSNFKIRTTSKAVQTIDFDGEEYTEWRFYVKPLRIGHFVIEIKVCIIELVEGEKEIREKVLEEKVLITANKEIPIEENDGFRQAGTAFGFINPKNGGVLHRLGSVLRSWQGIMGFIAVLLGSLEIYNNISEPDMLVAGSGDMDVRSVYLPDSTQVWLRRGAEIKYPEYFDGHERKVVISGEAYFEVKPQPDMPFRVETKNEGRVDVTGTAFGVLVTDTTIRVLVRSGKVLFFPKLRSEGIALSARQKASYKVSSDLLSVDNKTTLNELAWQTGGLEFIGTPLEEVIKDIEQYYGVQIVLNNPEMRTCPHTAPPTLIPVEKILESLSLTHQFELTNPTPGTFILSGGFCQ